MLTGATRFRSALIRVPLESQPESRQLWKSAMAQRQCPECGSELVLTRRPDGQVGPGMAPTSSPSTYWRCSVCGSAFTAEQIRKDKRDKTISA